MAHLWWYCPKIKTFWEKILCCIKKITKKEIVADPWTVLLHGGEGEVKYYRESLIPHLLNAAKSLIPKKWQETESPQIWEWFNSVEETYNMESLRYTVVRRR